MRRVPRTKQEEKNDIWFEEVLARADRGFEQGQHEFVVLERETLRGLVVEIIDDVMPPDTKNLVS